MVNSPGRQKTSYSSLMLANNHYEANAQRHRSANFKNFHTKRQEVPTDIHFASSPIMFLLTNFRWFILVFPFCFYIFHILRFTFYVLKLMNIFKTIHEYLHTLMKFKKNS